MNKLDFKKGDVVVSPYGMRHTVAHVSNERVFFVSMKQISSFFIEDIQDWTILTDDEVAELCDFE